MMVKDMGIRYCVGINTSTRWVTLSTFSNVDLKTSVTRTVFKVRWDGHRPTSWSDWGTPLAKASQFIIQKKACRFPNVAFFGNMISTGGATVNFRHGTVLLL